MAMGKKKGSFTFNDPTAAADAERKAATGGGGPNSVRVVLLDGSYLTIGPVDKKMLGQVAFDQVVRKLDLLERDYFGLLYEDDHKTTHWLDYLKPIKKQLKKQPYTLLFRVKFYAIDPLALHRNSKEQFYLQLKEDISAGRLHFSSDSAHSVLSYVLQADLGDYNNSHDDLHYLERKGFLVLGKDRIAESSIIKLHKLLQGKPSDQAVEKFLRKTRELDSYGAVFSIVQYEGIAYRMSMSPSGITLYQDTSRTTHYKWRKVLQVSYKQKKFTLTLKSRSAEGGEKTITYEVDSVKHCKEMWEMCVQRVSFYNEHQARYMERSERGNNQSRSPSPPTMRDYATINEATPQLEETRQQLQVSPAHSSEQGQNSQQQQRQQNDDQFLQEERQLEWRRRMEEEEEERDERHKSRRSREVHRDRKREHDHHKEQEESSERRRQRRREHEDNTDAPSSTGHRYSRSPPPDGEREGSEDRENSGGNTLRRRSKTQAGSLPRRLPTGDPMLYHMMQFQSLEAHSSRGTLLSDEDSPTETTSPIVSTCDEISECPELPSNRKSLSRGDRHSGIEGGHFRSFSLPQSDSWSHRHPDHHHQPLINGQGRENLKVSEALRIKGGHDRESHHHHHHHTKHQEMMVPEHSHSEEIEGDQSMHDSLEELADLLGDEEEEEEEREAVKEDVEEMASSATRENGLQRQTEAGSDTQSPVTQLLTNVKPKGESTNLGGDETPPGMDREERERRRRQKTLQKQILLQRQQLKEQMLHEYIEKEKQKKSGQTPEETRRKPEKKQAHREHAVQAKERHKSWDGMKISTHEKGHHQSMRTHRKDPSVSDKRHTTGDGRSQDKQRERKKEERDMVRSWARAHRKAQREASAAQSSVQSQPRPNPVERRPPPPPPPPPPHTEEPLYNRLAPLKKKEEEEEANEEQEHTTESHLLPSSPPPPPYQPPSPGHKLAVGRNRVTSTQVRNSISVKMELRTTTEMPTLQQSAANSHQITAPTTTTSATPPTPRMGENSGVGGGGGSNSTPSSNSSPKIPSVYRPPRHTQSFSGGGSPHSSSTGGSSATGSPRTPIRAHSLKTTQYSPGKQPSPPPSSLTQNIRGGGGGGVVMGSSNQSHIAGQGTLEARRDGGQQTLDATRIAIDPSVLQKEDLTIAPHNFLDTDSSPPYDKLEKVGDKDVPVPSPSEAETKNETQDNSKTAEDLKGLTEVQTPASSVPHHHHQKQQPYQQSQIIPAPPSDKIKPDMLAKSLDTSRDNPTVASPSAVAVTSSSTAYPPHIAKFMSRVRNSLTDVDDLMQQSMNQPPSPSHQQQDQTQATDSGISSQQRPTISHQRHTTTTTTTTTRAQSLERPHYDIPKTVLGRTVSLENSTKVPIPQAYPTTTTITTGPGHRQRSNTFQTNSNFQPGGKGHMQGTTTSYTLPRGNFAVGSNPREVLGAPPPPPPVHAHTRSDVTAGAADNWSMGGLLQSTSAHSFQHQRYPLSPSYPPPQNGSPQQNYKPPSVPITINRQHRGQAAMSGVDSIPNSPTYFTYNHPHRDDITPSPETQQINESFRDHLLSLQPSHGTRKTNIASWMQHSSSYWNTNKSTPFLKDSHLPNPAGYPPRVGNVNPHSSTATPSSSAAPTPVLGPRRHQQPLPSTRPMGQISTPPHRPIINRHSNFDNSLAASSSTASLKQRAAALGSLGSSQPLPNYPKKPPHSPASKTPDLTDSYYVLDV